MGLLKSYIFAFRKSIIKLIADVTNFLKKCKKINARRRRRMLFPSQSKSLHEKKGRIIPLQKILKQQMLFSKTFNVSNPGCAIFFNGGPNTNKHNILRAAPLNKIIFYRLLILPTIKIKL